jgi:hypothetical protein
MGLELGERIPEGTSSAHLEGVLLVYYNPASAVNRGSYLATHWASTPPMCHQIEVECLGMLRTKGTTRGTARGTTADGFVPDFRVEGVLPKAPMPVMDDNEERNFLRVLETTLAKQTGWTITGMSRDIVDWDGEDRHQ